MSKTDMPEHWMSLENFKELRLTFKDNQKPLEEMANTLLYLSHSSWKSSQGRNKGCSSERWQERKLKTFFGPQ